MSGESPEGIKEEGKAQGGTKSSCRIQYDNHLVWESSPWGDGEAWT